MLSIDFATVFVPLRRMPLNPNGKVDKPALPFPDTAQAATSAPGSRKLNTTEDTIRQIWTAMLPSAPQPIPSDESFFDLGGHSILATRLIFELRKVFVVDAPLGLAFDRPTIAGLTDAVDALRNGDLGFSYKPEAPLSTTNLLTVPGVPASQSAAPLEYGDDLEKLVPHLQDAYPALPADFGAKALTVFLTGATGFLGAFVLKDLLSRDARVKKVICLVRASDAAKGLERLKEGSTDRGVWDDAWVPSGRLEVVTGDLGMAFFGLGKDGWARVADEADVVLHNGALVCLTSLRSVVSMTKLYSAGSLDLSV
jgi:L-aminoadipate-semialdehyde dehydrogenase